MGALAKLRARLLAFREKRKVGKLGHWAPGDVLDTGDEYVAYITVNGCKNSVLVRSRSKHVALERRAWIIQAMMGASREEAQAAVQLIARSNGDTTEELHKGQ